MALAIATPPADLHRPRLRLLIEGVLSAGTLKATHEDLYAAGATLTGLYERLVLGAVSADDTGSDLDPFGGTSSFTFALKNIASVDYPNGRFSQWFSQEVRGSIWRLHLYEVTTGEERLGEVVGRLEAFSADAEKITCQVNSFTPGTLNDFAMTRLVTLADWPQAPANSLITGAVGTRFCRGIGVGEHVPMRYVRAPSVDGDPARFFEFAVEGTCSLQDVRSTTQSAAYIEGSDFTTQDRIVNAVPYTVARFSVGEPPEFVTAMVQRLGPDYVATDLARFPWTSLYDAIGGLVARTGVHPTLGVGSVNSGDLVVGHTNAGLGALDFRYGDPNPYLEIPDATALALQTFSVSFGLYLGVNAHGPLIVSPNATTDSGANTQYGWAVDLASTRVLRLLSQFTGGGMVIVGATPSTTMPVGAWALISLVRNGTAGTWQLYIDRTLALNVADSGGPKTIDYSGADNLLLGAYKRGGAAAFAGDIRIGELRWSSVAWTAAQVSDRVDRWRRNPAVWLAEEWQRCGESVDATALATALTALDTVNGGALECDHWITDPTVRHRDVMQAVAQMRSIRFGRTTAGAITFTVPTEPTAVVQVFGCGKGTAGNARFVSRNRDSLSDAVTGINVLYRPGRDLSGGLTGWDALQPDTVRTLPDVQRDPVPYYLPCVYQHRTADQVRDWLVKELRRRDEVVQITAGKDARTVRRGDVVRIRFTGVTITGSFDPGGFDPGGFVTEITGQMDYEVIRRQLAGPLERTLECCSYDSALWLYDAHTLPVDAIIDHSAELVLGNACTIEMVSLATNPRRVGVVLHLQHTETLHFNTSEPSSIEGIATNQGVVVGAPTHAAVLGDENDATYIDQFGPLSAGHGIHIGTFIPPAAMARGRIIEMDFVARAAHISGSGSPLIGVGWAVRKGGSWVLTYEGGFQSISSNVPTDYHGLSTIYYGATKWTLADLISQPGQDGPGEVRLVALLDTSVGDLLRLYQMRLKFTTELLQPGDLGGVVWYAKRSNAGEIPPTPLEGVDAGSPLQGALDYVFTEQLIDQAGVWYAWAAVYDVLGRQAALIGPQMMLVPA